MRGPVMRRTSGSRSAILIGAMLGMLGCGPGAAVSGSESGEPGESESQSSADSSDTQDTDEPCLPGELDCECLPDSPHCDLDPWGAALGCNSANRCRRCGFELTAIRPACRGDACPAACTLDLVELGVVGPVASVVVPFTEVTLDGVQLPRGDESCMGVDGWIWSIEAERVLLCNDACELWTSPGGPLQATVKFWCLVDG